MLVYSMTAEILQNFALFDFSWEHMCPATSVYMSMNKHISAQVLILRLQINFGE